MDVIANIEFTRNKQELQRHCLTLQNILLLRHCCDGFNSVTNPPNMIIVDH